MKYETPELTALTPAINAIQTLGSKDTSEVNPDGIHANDSGGGYADWE